VSNFVFQSLAGAVVRLAASSHNASAFSASIIYTHNTAYSWQPTSATEVQTLLKLWN